MAEKLVSYLKGARISPKKVRPVIKHVKGKDVEQALALLKFMPRKAASILYKMVSDSVANAENQGIDIDRLVVTNITADDGKRIKRMRPRAMGRAFRILKRLSNIKVTLSIGR